MASNTNSEVEDLKTIFNSTLSLCNSDSEKISQAVEVLTQEISNLSKIKAAQQDSNSIKELFSYLDITSLNSCDTSTLVQNMCRAIIQPEKILKPAAVCFFPSFCEIAKQTLKDSSIKLAVVEDSFPHGNSPLPSRAYGVRRCIEAGADEIDMVISRGAANSGDFDFIRQEVSTLKGACGDKMLKVILNTAELKESPNVSLNRYSFIYKLSLECLRSGADFLKTSTGKEGINADLSDSIAMCLALSNYSSIQNSASKKGFKAAGGIRKLEDALVYKILAQLTFNNLSSEVFRIGASSLAQNLEQIFVGKKPECDLTQNY
jgi:deoxyribose-phosphate aldolase